MKIITIPDLHGKDAWKKLKVDEYDKIIFLGDYVDSFTIYSVEVVVNLEEIISFKRNYPDKVELLLGNHDMHYLFYPAYRCTGFNWQTQVPLTKLFRENRELFKYAYQIKNHLWTHAGVSNAWFEENKEIFNQFVIKDLKEEFAKVINLVGESYLNILTMSSYIRNGDYLHGGILWADLKETYNDYLTGFHQYVGHSKVPEMIRFKDADSSIHYLDCLDTIETFFTVQI